MVESSHDVIREAAVETGWTSSHMVEILCDFIDNQCEQEVFQAFVEDRVILEKEFD